MNHAEIERLSPAAALNEAIRRDWPRSVEVYTSAFYDSDCCSTRFDRICRAGEDDLYICSKCGELCDPRRAT